MSLVYNYPYNKKIADKLSNYQYMWQPESSNTFIRSRSGGAMYAMPGSSATYPMLDMVSQRIYDRGRPSKGEALMKVRPTRPVAPSTQKKGGAKSKKLTHKQLAQEIAMALNDEMVGGAIDWEQIKQISKPYLKKGITMGLNVGVPALSKAIGKALGGEEGEMVGKVARDLIKKQTGYGRKQQMDGGISLSKLKKKTKPYVSAGLDAVVPGVGGLVGTMVEPGAGTVVGTLAGQLGPEGLRSLTGYGAHSKDVGVYKGGAKAKPKPKVKPKAKPRAKPNSGGRNKRNEIVKRVMREKGMSLPQASSYVKQNNLY